MKQNVNKSELITKTKGAVWKLKLDVNSLISEESHQKKAELKLWKIKVILN